MYNPKCAAKFYPVCVIKAHELIRILILILIRILISRSVSSTVHSIIPLSLVHIFTYAIKNILISFFSVVISLLSISQKSEARDRICIKCLTKCHKKPQILATSFFLTLSSTLYTLHNAFIYIFKQNA